MTQLAYVLFCLLAAAYPHPRLLFQVQAAVKHVLHSRALGIWSAEVAGSAHFCGEGL